MGVGQAIDKGTIDAQVGALPKELAALFNRIQLFASHMDAVVDATLTAMGYTAGDIALMRSAYRDLDKLRQVWQGTATVAANGAVAVATTGYDFRSFTKQVDGVGY